MQSTLLGMLAGAYVVFPGLLYPTGKGASINIADLLTL